MKGMKAHCLFVIALVLGIVVSVCPAFGQTGTTETTAIWPTYHYDTFRGGQNANSKDMKDPSTLKAIFAFPRADAGSVVNDKTRLVVDDADKNFDPVGIWPIVKYDKTKKPPDYDGQDAVGESYHYTDVKRVTTLPRYSTATWYFPSDLPKGRYQVFVWLPANERASNAAEYVVTDDYGGQKFTLDQLHNSGTWALLTNTFFTFTGAKAKEGVSVSALAPGSLPGQEVVVADAVRFMPVPSIEIYSSPTSANIPITLKDPAGSTIWGPDKIGTCVYTGTVEQSSPSAPGVMGSDKGAVYCIYSVTPTIKTPRLVYDPDKTGPGDPDKPTDPDNPTPVPGMDEAEEMIKISKFLGKPKWRYPRNGTDPEADDYINKRDNDEGPIAGGVWSSPTLATVWATNAEDNKLTCFVTGMLDRQMYAIDAIKGKLIWKGPGCTVGEEEDTDDVKDWALTDTREDAFGGKFHYLACVDPSDKDFQTIHKRCKWEFTEARQKATRPDPDHTEGYSYSIYAWIPDAGGTSNLKRSRNATYVITYPTGNTEKPTDTATVTVDQSDPKYWGTWVKIGTSYFNPSMVELYNTASPDPPASEGATGPKPSDYAVIADAVMFVPDTIDGMGKSTPITDADPTKNANGLAKVAFATASNGRVMAFDLVESSNRIGRLKWIYPAVRMKMQAGPEDMDKPALGQLIASPVYWDDRLFVAAMNATVTCIKGVTGFGPYPDWHFVADTDTDGLPPGFSASPAFDGTNLYLASTKGHVYCLSGAGVGKSDSGSLSPIWEYPKPKVNETDPLDNPLGGVMFSTPAIATPRASAKRLWIASSDGVVHSLWADTGQRLFTDDLGNGYNGPPTFEEPSFGKDIQASIALDGGASDKHIMMYVGDISEDAGQNSGTLHWRDAETGLVVKPGAQTDEKGDPYSTWKAPGIMFASPNITHLKVEGTDISYVYQGCGDGHLIAFSKAGGAWGGEWQGGEWPFEGDADTQNAQRASEAPVTDIQFDVFDEPFFTKSLNLDPEPDKTTFDPTKWPDTTNGIDDAIVSKDMKVPQNGATPIDDYLTNEAKKRRSQTTLATSRLNDAKTGIATNTVFYEWGEKIYCIVWNLPEQRWLSGSSISDKIKPRMTNQSCGESAGATSGGQTGNVNGLVMQVRAIKDYSCLRLDNTVDPPVYTELTQDGKPVRRSYALISIDIDGTRDRPPGPGPGWALYIDIDKYVSLSDTNQSAEPTVHLTVPLAKLTPGKYGYDLVIQNNQVREAALGINNALAIRDDGILNDANDGGVSIGYWSGSNGRTADRTDKQAHLNGNYEWATNTNTGNSQYQPYNMTKLPNPLIYLQQVVHGTSSRQAPLGVMDRSAMGTSGRSIPRFRVDARDLRFRGDETAIGGALSAIECPPLDPLTGKAAVNPLCKYGFKFPWDQGIGSIDYPYIYARYQNYQLLSSDIDPASKATPLLAVTPTTTPAAHSTSLVHPDAVLISADVPKYQPANETGDIKDAPGGYSRTMVAYIDSNGDGGLDSGNSAQGRPTTWQETYRTFRVELKVPPDPKLEVEEQTIDIGRAPHGLGQNMPAGLEFTAYNKNPLIQQWFKPITIKNAGNVNLYNIRLDQLLGLLGDQASPSQQLPGVAITSSLNVPPPPGPFGMFASDPFLCSSANNAAGSPTYLGYTLSKPRVGDVDPTVMTIPDRRRWDNLYYDKQEAQSIMGDKSIWGPYAWDKSQPMPVLVSVQVPLTQPIGTYQSWDNTYRMPYVSVFADQQNLAANGPVSPRYGVDPMAVPSFQLKLAVRENQLTGGATPTTLPMVDYLDDGTAPPDGIPKFGDATPAAYRDANNIVHMFWSTNRLAHGTPPPETDDELANFASAPWFINEAQLDYNNASWIPTTKAGADSAPAHWWNSTLTLPSTDWPAWPTTPPPASTLVPYGNTGHSLVRHFSPSIGENLAVAAAGDSNNRNRTWLTWAGTAEVKDPDNKIRQESLIYYTDMTAPSSSSNNNTTSTPQVFAIEHDPSQLKRYPSCVPDGNDMWMFWQGGNSGNWSIYYSMNHEGGPTFDATHPWSDDTKLRTPDCLAAVGSPNPILRHFWADIRTPSSTDFTNPFKDEYNVAGVKKVFDVVYAGTNKLTRNSDIMLSRYLPSLNPADSPGRVAQPLPRVFNEKLARDPKLGFYTSQHIAWKRLASGATPVVDKWGQYFNYLAPAPNNHVASNYPFVHVFFPKGYTTNGLTVPADLIVSATDGSAVKKSDGGVIEPPMEITPEIDSVSGVYTYNYTRPSTFSGVNYADRLLGKMIVDFSSGIIRFKTPFVESATTNADGVKSFSAPEVYADYTPQALRITTDSAVDGSPRAFIERTSMTDSNDSGSSTGNPKPRLTPGLDPDWPNSKPAPVDRMWVFWRKTGTGIQNSTIFYTTMRIGIDLTKLGLPPIPMNAANGTISSTAFTSGTSLVGNALGPWEVDRTGKKIYFSEVDERYRSAQFGGPAIHLAYKYQDDNNSTQTMTADVQDVTWITELPEQSLGYSMDANVNEGSIYAFADPQPQFSGTSAGVRSSKIWVFWTSTRGGNSDLFWETLSPNFWGR